MSQFSESLVEQFEPWINATLQQYLEDGFAGMFEELEFYAFDTDVRDGWTVLFDPQDTPDAALPYLAQFVGYSEPFATGPLTPANLRDVIVSKPNQKRGTPQSIIDAAKILLTGDKSVLLIERFDGDVDAIYVRTYASETPDPAAVLAKLQAVVPADLILTYDVDVGQSWRDVLTHGTWQDVKDDYATWRDVMEDTP